jgi:hypothetical protein
MIDYNQLSGLLGLSKEDVAKQEQSARADALSALGTALIKAGMPQQGPKPTLLARLGMAAPAYSQAYEESRRQNINDVLQQVQLRQKLSEAGKPKYMTLKNAAGADVLIQIPTSGTPSPVNIPGMQTTKPIEFDPKTQAYILYKYPGKTFGELNQDQQADILAFANAPDDEKTTSLRIEQSKSKFETGVDVPIPKGRSEFFVRPPATQPVQPAPSSTAPVQVTPVAPTSQPTSVAPIAPAQTMAAGPVSAEAAVKPTSDSSISGIKIPMSLVSKPMGDKEVPLIESSGISPKQKQELLLQRPQQTGAVESVVNTNRQMRSVIDEILANPGLKDAFGLGGEAMSKFPGSNAARVRALLERLGGNLFVDAITAMRNASKTGAAVGNATEKEGDKLQASRAALTQAQKAEDAIRELTALRAMLEQQESIVVNAYNRTYGQGSFQFTPVTPAPNMRKPLDTIFGGQR